MTTSTTYFDVTRVAAMPRTPGVGAAQRLEQGPKRPCRPVTILVTKGARTGCEIVRVERQNRDGSRVIELYIEKRIRDLSDYWPLPTKFRAKDVQR